MAEGVRRKSVLPSSVQPKGVEGTENEAVERIMQKYKEQEKFEQVVTIAKAQNKKEEETFERLMKGETPRDDQTLPVVVPVPEPIQEIKEVPPPKPVPRVPVFDVLPVLPEFVNCNSEMFVYVKPITPEPSHHSEEEIDDFDINKFEADLRGQMGNEELEKSEKEEPPSPEPVVPVPRLPKPTGVKTIPPVSSFPRGDYDSTYAKPIEGVMKSEPEFELEGARKKKRRTKVEGSGADDDEESEDSIPPIFKKPPPVLSITKYFGVSRPNTTKLTLSGHLAGVEIHSQPRILKVEEWHGVRIAAKEKIIELKRFDLISREGKPTEETLERIQQLEEAIKCLSRLDLSAIDIRSHGLRARLAPKTSEVKYSTGIFRGTTVCGIPAGRGHFDYKDGSRAEGSLFNDKWEGEKKKSDARGARTEGRVLRGKWEGYHVFYSPDGQIDRGCKMDGHWQGPVFSDMPGGELLCCWNELGRQSGRFLYADRERTEMRFGEFIDGTLHGERRIFTLTQIQTYDHGKLMKNISVY